MPQQRLYYEYVENTLIPYWYVLTFKTGEINWNKAEYYFDSYTPFEFVGRDQFDDSLNTKVISLSDIIRRTDSSYKIGLNIQQIKKRIEEEMIDPYVVRQFIMMLPDIKEYLHYISRNRNATYIVND